MGFHINFFKSKNISENVFLFGRAARTVRAIIKRRVPQQSEEIKYIRIKLSILPGSIQKNRENASFYFVAIFRKISILLSM
ncbi:hypothetical protein CO024_02000 [Candidatus Gracilibacteria bacterium CG_4_9_14_0_2_um_filter_38_7]|nr:MAG: hypothetical protein COW68_00600 [Candidatus Gracilibacteria bacterium CG18_big_fil_WC_8_21_14_2_50_38_16]PIQ41475.1 MAG: hypothetical protein COW06_02735 [Candidatus Gracilibacteria bacterium CG12_big_fil_rev_8_21_14_0_65_38_15]PIZ01781.1 MAG: hypothetical protein COY60_01680 [Candidatus Gracilibacteria bacterium CG_4_10_14_0_8_um_filter_38_28]PJC56630.1 MAG: hypothetical protein CO024_02000 [Candidatus Gracilibacteria bacterium CG_4_9_14_0_2_um_filter_38_7]